jgi:hypothetical protein
MGPEESVVGHYSGDASASGARASDWVAGVRKAKAYHHDHQVIRGWAGIGYHYLIPDDGSIICCRSTFHTGAHVEGQNDARIGVNMPGTVGHRPTRKQARAFNWLLHNAHTAAMPRVHRTDRDLSRLPRFGHKDLGNTSCPGLFHGMYKRGGEPWVEPSSGLPEADDVSSERDGLFFPLAPEDEQVLAEIDAGNVPDLDAEQAAFGPDAEELEGRNESDERLELPEADEDADEDLSELIAEIDLTLKAAPYISP